MTSRRSRHPILAATGSVATLTIAGLVAIGSPAGAVSGTLTYDCTALSGPEVFTAVVDTDAPATLPPGASASINVTSTITVPASRMDLLRQAMITQVDGSASATGTVDGVSRVVSLAIPRTDVPASMGTALPLVGTGPGGNIQAGAAGTTIELGAGNFSVHIVGYNASGTLVGQDTWTCTLQPAQALHVDSVLVQAPTTTTVSVGSPVMYGDTATVKADVTVTGSTTKPDGTVQFSIGGKSVVAPVKGGKAKANLPAALAMGVQQVTAAFTTTDSGLAGSVGGATVTVVRDHTTTAATATYRQNVHRLVAKATVAAVHGTGVDGQVKLVLKRNGHKVDTAKVPLNQKDRAKHVFRNIAKPGHYILVARYLGSTTLARSVDRAKLVV
jgi:hypothetical protein